jgi:O-succinylbenzoic acid--CoA ligase
VKLVTVERLVARWSIDGRGAARGHRERAALIVEIETATGARGSGEAAPLPGLSIDTLDDAERAADALDARLPCEVPDGADGIAAFAAALSPSPAARFAIEAALLEALAVERGGSLATLLEALAVPAPPWLPPSVVVDTADEARQAASYGVPALKLKVGPDGELARIRAIAAAAPRVRLRLDANRGWPAEAVADRLAALAGLPIDYIEEPCPGAHHLLADPLPIRIALDESLAALSDGEVEAALRAPGLGALLLKPTLIGLSRTLTLAARARAAGVPALVTHCLESPVGRAVVAAIANAQTAGAAAPALVTRTATLSFAELAATAAAAEVLATGTDDEEDTDPAAPAALAPIAQPAPLTLRPRFLIATPSPGTLAAIHAALAERRPIALFHPNLSPVELVRRRAAVRAARLPAGAAAVLFTSGSTGEARGVVLSRDALDAAADASARHLAWRSDDRWLLALSLAHAGGLAVAVRCLAARRPVVLVEDAAELPALLARCTLASLVPAQLAALLDDPSWRPPPQLRAVLLGGAAAPPSLLAAAAERGVPFLTTYGMTETFGQIATAAPSRAGDPAAPLVPLPGVALEAGTRDAPAPIRVRAPMLALQYLDGTPIAPAFTTADLGFFEGTALRIVGRTDDVIVSGGAKVHPLEVEAVLAATPGVLAACVFGVPDERWGQLVGAALATAPAFDLAAAAARWHAALPAHARPRRLALAPELPLTPTGKPDRRAAAELPHEPVRYSE